MDFDVSHGETGRVRYVLVFLNVPRQGSRTAGPAFEHSAAPLKRNNLGL